MVTNLLKTFTDLAEQVKNMPELHNMIDVEAEILNSVVTAVKYELSKLTLEELREELAELMYTFYYIGLTTERNNLFNTNNTCTQNIKEELS